MKIALHDSELSNGNPMLTPTNINPSLERLVCAGCGDPAETDNGLCEDCESDLCKLECAFDVRDYATEGEV